MRTARTVLAWAGGLSVFAVMVFALVLLPFFLRPRDWDPLAKALSRALVACFGARVAVRGAGNLATGRGQVLVCNHVNLLDGFLLYGHLPCHFRVLEQAEHFSWPIWGWFSRRFGNVSLDQRGGGRTAGALRGAAGALSEGRSILVFPEGHRTQDGFLRDFYRGAFRLALRSDAELVPLVQAGSWELLRKGGGGVHPGEVELTILPPWTAERRVGLDESAFRDLVRSEMALAYAESRGRVTPASQARVPAPAAGDGAST